MLHNGGMERVSAIHPRPVQRMREGRKISRGRTGEAQHNLSKFEIKEAGATSSPLPAAPFPARRAVWLDPPWRCGVSVRLSGCFEVVSN